MTFRTPLTSNDVDTGFGSTAGVRIYQDKTGTLPRGVIAFYSGITPSGIVEAYPVAQGQGGGNYTTAGTRARFKGVDDTAHGVTAPQLDLNVEADPLGGYLSVGRLSAGGKALQLDDYGLSLSGDSWKTYDAAWQTAGGTPSLGGGSLTGKFWRLGQLCFVKIFLSCGQSFNGGVGVWTFGLPFPAASGYEQRLAVKVFAVAGNFDGYALFNGGSRITPNAETSPTDTRKNPVQNANNAGTAGTGVPLASGAYSFGSGSNVVIDGFYEIAAGS